MKPTAFYLVWWVSFSIWISICHLHAFQHNRVRIGVDFGPKLIGIAQANYLGKARSVKALTNPGNFSTISRQIVGIAERLSAYEIIVGVPVDKHGILGYGDVENKNGRMCLDFSQVLCCWANRLTNGKITVKLYDERYSTREAMYRTKSHDSKGMNFQNFRVLLYVGLHVLTTLGIGLDTIAAICILERYLEEEGASAIDAIACSYPPPISLEMMHRSVLQRHVRYRDDDDDDDEAE
jgi:RNase H-fold protein (predicted Holliday junction resolvase)